MNAAQRIEYTGETYERLATIRIGTQTVDGVRCPCGYISLLYRWSWAGHRVLRCRARCGRYLSYTEPGRVYRQVEQVTT